MWTMGCSDCSELNINKSDGRKLRPVMPRPPNSLPSSYFLAANPSYTTPQLPKTDPFSFNDHLAAKHEQSRPEINTAASVRWNPTPEQLRVLEELYGGGTRTPTADQIKLIAGKLRRFGKIEGKNVFYWFQNHKARERQKRRRHHTGSPEPDDVTGFEVDEHAKNKPSSKCSTITTEESVSVHRAVASEITIDEWIQLEERELMQQRRRRRSTTQSNHATWQLMKPSSTPPPPPPPQVKFMDMRFLPNCRDMNVTEFEEESGKPPTLQLFPIRSSGNRDPGVEERENEVSMAPGVGDTSFSPNEFFEFLPLKN